MPTIQEALAEQRQHVEVEVDRLSEFLYGQAELAKLQATFKNRSPVPYDFNVYGRGRVQQIKDSFRKFVAFYPQYIKEQSSIVWPVYSSIQQFPASIHSVMFIKSIQIMGTVKQQKEYLKKCYDLDIIGCYAQTELGHGSDVQNLETTATYDEKKQQFIINTPTITAAKFWPGDMGIIATHALVFAQTISKAVNYGVYSFLVPIRDEQLRPLKGIEVGDIGPKLGFHTKDNGYLIMKNVAIPRRNMLRRFVSVSQAGQLKKKGDPKVSYATMMSIRMHISSTLPKQYSQAIAIAARYSVFRKQFLDKHNQQIRIIDYILQKDKIISRLAQFYAITAAGNKIKALCVTNEGLVKNNSDFSLMGETHACLALGKAFFSDTIHQGLEICRKACGGHGFSIYSGLPTLCHQYAANVTLEGQNTVMYLQVARFLLKSYQNSITKKKPLSESVGYLESFSTFLSRKLTENQKSTPEDWKLDDLRSLLAQAVCIQIAKVGQKIMQRPKQLSQSSFISGFAGIDLKNLAVSHSAYYTFVSFLLALTAHSNEINRIALTDLCLLYGANVLLAFSVALIEHEAIKPCHIESLRLLKQAMLHRIRLNLIGFVDAFAIPNEYLRSSLIKGDPYENMFNLAKVNDVNQGGVSESAFIVRDGVKQALKIHRQKEQPVAKL